jgi:predicted transcriptional regulator
VTYDNVLTIKVDDDTNDELENMALFERKKKATFCRETLVQTVQKYRRNPQYLKFKKQLEGRKK